jgi:hypothetical protein
MFSPIHYTRKIRKTTMSFRYVVDSEEESVHLDTPPKGRGRCCAAEFCRNPSRSFYPTYQCDKCKGHPHEQGCFVFEESIYVRFDKGKLYCLKCNYKMITYEKNRKKRERAKFLKEERERKAAKLKAKNPFTEAAKYAEMMKKKGK